ncbi:MAG: hypothetical protein FWF63_06825 [Fibromonadales bacterium]|nr:hypothetical protein [Fibromonadales bacterium]
MKTNTMNILIILALTFVLTSCGDHSWGDLFESSSSSGETDDNPSSSSKKKQSSSSSNIVINDEDIVPAADFASEFFEFVTFPFIDAYGHGWLRAFSIESDLEYFVDRLNDENGGAFKSLFSRLYDNMEEYLRNGKMKRYVEILAGLIPHETYVYNGWDEMVRQLLIAYDDIKAKSSFSDIYDVMESNCNSFYDDEDNFYKYCQNATDVYEEILPFARDPQLKAFILKQNISEHVDWNGAKGSVNKSAVVWAYSFWGRRYHENKNIIDPIVDILRLLRDKYPE